MQAKLLQIVPWPVCKLNCYNSPFKRLQTARNGLLRLAMPRKSLPWPICKQNCYKQSLQTATDRAQRSITVSSATQNTANTHQNTVVRYSTISYGTLRYELVRMLYRNNHAYGYESMVNLPPFEPVRTLYRNNHAYGYESMVNLPYTYEKHYALNVHICNTQKNLFWYIDSFK